MSARTPTEPGIATALAALRQPFVAGDQPTFLSDLTVGELVLLEEIGYRPVDIVSGAGSASWNPQFTTAATEGNMWGRAIATAIDNARSGILEELRSHRADGVVAMKFELEREHANLLTCTMLGTAVHGADRRAGSAQPFATTLSARDFHLLVRAGYHPVGIVIGVSVVGFAARSASQSLGLSRDNVELSDQTTALYSAREKAMEMMEREAAELHADGVVEVQLQERPVNALLTHAVEFIAVGTAVCRGPDGHRDLGPEFQLTLEDPPDTTFSDR
ncbi:MAG TPA: heavy metal-binding domain-containing protein [Acidimicrobiales bacterium]|nr:heavy metal-binding domain-containing protein [Acidimicrobiales bacterium]